MNIQKLRDMNLHAVADELEQLREFKAEIESQEPVYFWKEIGESDWMECGKDWYWKCADSPEHDTKLLYAKPVPADKPAVAVPGDHEAIDTASLRKGFGTAKGKVEQMAAYHAALNACCDEIDRLRSKVVAALSHSQQSDNQFDGWQIALKVREALDRKACPDAFMRIAVEEIERLLCAVPSHSQQSAETVPADKPAEKLTAPARVGSTIFGVGVDTSAVIERAQREYEYRAALKADPVEQVPDAIQLLQRVAASTTDSDELIRLRSELESCKKLLKLSGRVNSKLMDELFAFKKPRYKRADDLVIGDTILHEGDEVFIESIENFGGYVRINESETLSPPEAQMKMVYPEQTTHDSERADQE